jgi:glycosyltransferase involved in cell wall biosynthesis
VSRRLLVVTTVHPPDDPRIREKLIRTLGGWEISYAAREHGPSDDADLTFKPLKGGRVSRWFGALWEMLGADIDVVVVHDPELIPAGLVVRFLRRKPVVLDLHEDLPAQILTKAKVPTPLRRPLSSFSQWWLSQAERHLHVTLAEHGYQHLFMREHRVFPNYPDATLLPVADTDPGGPVVYVGDVTEARGATDLVEAAGGAEIARVVFVGRCTFDLSERLRSAGQANGVAVDVVGWLPYREAMEIAATASVGVAPLRDEPNYRNSLPTKTLEYLAMGVPVIASDLPGTREVIGELPGVVLVPPGNPRALAVALTEVDADLRAAAAQGVGEVQRRFRWPADAVRDYYDSLLPDAASLG